MCCAVRGRGNAVGLCTKLEGWAGASLVVVVRNHMSLSCGVCVCAWQRDHEKGTGRDLFPRPGPAPRIKRKKHGEKIIQFRRGSRSFLHLVLVLGLGLACILHVSPSCPCRLSRPPNPSPKPQAGIHPNPNRAATRGAGQGRHRTHAQGSTPTPATAAATATAPAAGILPPFTPQPMSCPHACPHYLSSSH